MLSFALNDLEVSRQNIVPCQLKSLAFTSASFLTLLFAVFVV